MFRGSDVCLEVWLYRIDDYTDPNSQDKPFAYLHCKIAPHLRRQAYLPLHLKLHQENPLFIHFFCYCSASLWVNQTLNYDLSDFPKVYQTHLNFTAAKNPDTIRQQNPGQGRCWSTAATLMPEHKDEGLVLFGESTAKITGPVALQEMAFTGCQTHLQHCSWWHL